MDISEFQQSRSKYQPQVPHLFNFSDLRTKTHQVEVQAEIRKLFPNLCKQEQLDAISFERAGGQLDQINTPLRVGCVLSGGQAAGGHNVIVGMYEQLKKRHPNSQLFGFLKGPIGLYYGKYVELKDDEINFFKNRGGFDMIKSGRIVETEDQFAKNLQICQSLKLDGLVVIGGDGSNTNTCLMAEYFLKNGSSTCVIGCPKTIDGDLKNEQIEVSFGFDTACKTYSELIGNIMLDTVSSKKYYHFIRLMGRSASHITLECALTTKPNWAFIGEEIEQSKQSLESIVKGLVDLILQRAEQGKNYGVILVPEGMIEFIDEIKNLIHEINSILKQDHSQISNDQLYEFVKSQLQVNNQMVLDQLPSAISNQLLIDRDPHGNVQVAKIETEKLLISMIEMELKRRKGKVPSFKTVNHYYGYEGRCAFPSNFDCDYCYSLGMNAALLIEARQTGLMSVIKNLDKLPKDWQAAGYPLVTMMDVERKNGKLVPVFQKALVKLDGELFQIYKKYRPLWAYDDHYQSPGPIQFYFKCCTPYLVKAPTDEQLGLYPNDIDYSKDGLPYEQIQRKNMSSLALTRSEASILLPPQLNLSLTPRTIEDTKYSNQLMKSLSQNYPELMAHSRNSLQFLTETHDSQQQLLQLEKTSLKLGICMNGRQSPGGNVIIQGFLEFADQTNSTLFGFVGGTKGLFENKTIHLTQQNIRYYVNSGGYHLLGRTADKMRSPSELEALKKTCLALDLDGLVLVGASQTFNDSLVVSNYLIKQNIKTRVVAIPCTLDNNMYHPMLEAIIGFDTASKIYSQLIGNIMIDAASAVKYWYFIRLMGRDPSHLVLECALQTHPNVVLISEDIEQRGLTLQEVVNEVADIIVLRSDNNKEFGTVLIPEGLLIHIGQFKQLINELNKVYSQLPDDRILQEKVQQQLLFDQMFLKSQLTPWSAALFLDLPDFTRKQLVIEREVNGGVQLSMIETERLLSRLVSVELDKRKQNKKYKGNFSSVCHFFGYQGRCGFPTLFDCNLAYSYGYLAGLIILNGKTGYCVCARGVTGIVKIYKIYKTKIFYKGPLNKWHFFAIPILNMTSLKFKNGIGENEPLVSSYNVDTKKAPFQTLKSLLSEWWLTDHYENPGPTQYFGPLANKTNKTLELTYKNYVDQIEQIENLSNEVAELWRYETNEDLLKIIIDQISTLLKTVQFLKKQT